MGKQELTGYSFPRLPDNWTESERMFALELRRLFDTIFGEQADLSRDVINNTNRLSEMITQTGKDLGTSIAELTNSLKETNDRFNDVFTQISEINDKLEEDEEAINETNGRIDNLYDEFYPVGISVLWNSSTAAPFAFGTWEIENIDPDTQEPVPDAYGHYMWRRVVDPDDGD